MVNCEECDKKLGIIEGYRHPVLGKKYLVCRNCFDKVDESIEKWRKFCLSNSFNSESSRFDIQEAWNKSISDDHPQQEWFNNLWIKIDKALFIKTYL